MAKVGQGDTQQCKGKAGTSTDEICKGSALFRNDTKRHSRDLYRIDLQRKSFDTKGNGNEQRRKAMAETGGKWRSNVSNGIVWL